MESITPDFLALGFAWYVVLLLSAAAKLGGDLTQRHPRRAAWMSLAGPAANFRHPDSVNFSRIVQGTQPGAATGAAILVSILFSLTGTPLWLLTPKTSRNTTAASAR